MVPFTHHSVRTPSVLKPVRLPTLHNRILDYDQYMRGLYAAFFENWGRYFTGNKIHVYASDDLFSSYGATVGRIVKDMTGVDLDNVKVVHTNKKSERIVVNDSFRDYLSEIYRPHNLNFKCMFPIHYRYFEANRFGCQIGLKQRDCGQ